MAKFDPSQPHGEILGSPHTDARFVQNGVLFDAQGRECDGFGRTIYPKPAKAAPASKPASRPAVDEAVEEIGRVVTDLVEDELAAGKTARIVPAAADAPGAKPLSELPWSDMRLLALSHGAKPNMKRFEMQAHLEAMGITHAAEG